MLQGWGVLIKQMRQTVFQDANLTLFQSAINDQFQGIATIPFMNGNLLPGVSLVAATASTITHGLKKVPSGYFIISNLQGCTIWNDAFTSDTTITLHTSSDTTVSLWVF